MARCPVTFNAKRELAIVEDFTHRADLYRRVKRITEADALVGLPLLLTGDAQTWWRGVGASIHTWNDALARIHTSFVPRRRNHELYQLLFASKQSPSESTEVFVATKRAIIAEITHQASDAQEIDMVYGLLHFSIRKEIPRDEITDFESLIDKARHVEGYSRRRSRPRARAPPAVQTNLRLPSRSATRRRRQSPNGRDVRSAGSSATRSRTAVSYKRKRQRPERPLRSTPLPRLPPTGSAAMGAENPVTSGRGARTAKESSQPALQPPSKPSLPSAPSA